ncbi:MAG TPA: AraC family transcriptional regulator [Pedobacter sp.]
MKPFFEKVALEDSHSFIIRNFDLPYFDMPWHYHPEFELTLITHGEGKRFVGDCIEDFKENDLVMTGPNLPHYWKNSEAYYNENTDLKASALVVHLGEEFPESQFFLLKELKKIKNLFSDAALGLRFSQEVSKKVRPKLERMLTLKGYQKINLLLDILDFLSRSKSEVLCSSGFTNALRINESERINKVYGYIMENFREDITLKEAATIAGMSNGAFSRYFRKKTKKNFITFINELRIGYACKLLLNNEMNVAEICYETGYTNLSNFNRQFKSVVHLTPSRYKNLHLNDIG